MIGMLIADSPERERRELLRLVRYEAAIHTEEEWRYLECGSAGELHQYLKTDDPVDLFMLDITMKGILECAKMIRSAQPGAYMILIANASISPLLYMRPQIRAESLLFKPVTKEMAREVLSEAVGSFAERFRKPDESKVFVAESRGSRELIDFNRIRYFESREKKVFVNTGSREIGFYETLDVLEDRFPETFIRCHRSFLVNRDRIASVMLSRNLVVLTDGAEIPLSRSCKAALKEFIRGRSV
ncbi:MAG: DNA-binding response regulator [Lachnospiraceae bacterium]|nr:DNA-binding response regulator [Lachnospiraceae bacterium]